MHTTTFFRNNTERKINVLDISVFVAGIKIQGEEAGDQYRSPIIDSTQAFDVVIKTNKMEFESGLFKQWILNNGSNLTLGILTQIGKLLPVAEYNGMENSDDSYDIFSKRCFIANGIYTVDIKDYERIKGLNYLIFNLNQEGDGGYGLTQKMIKLKN